MPRICFVAGDPSGDLHAAELVEKLKEKDATLTFTGLGGPAMRRSGVQVLDDLTQAASIGPFDAIQHLSRFIRARGLLSDHLKTNRPDLVILVDFGDFNLPVIAPLVKRHGLPVLYYISPQLWAWGAWRLRAVRRSVDRMIVFFPFEERFYRRAGIPVTWVGHPLIEEARPTLSSAEAFERFGLNPWRRTIGLLPGSRAHEIHRLLPLMLAVAEKITAHMPGVQFLLPRAPSIDPALLAPFLQRARCSARLAETGSLPDALQLMEVALVASGTATLEAALCGVPMAVVYRMSWPTYLAARLLVRTPHIGLVNVVAGRRLVSEFVQHRAQPEPIANALIELLRDDEQREKMRSHLREVASLLGPPGATERAAQAVMDQLRARSGPAG